MAYRSFTCWSITNNDNVKAFLTQSESCIVYIQIAFQIWRLFSGVSSKFFLRKCLRWRKALDLCGLVAPETSLYSIKK